MVRPAVRQSLRVLRYVVALFLALTALYSMSVMGDWIGTLLSGVFAGLVWPKKVRKVAGSPGQALGAPPRPYFGDQGKVQVAVTHPARRSDRSTKPPLISERARFVSTAVAFGVLGTALLVMPVGALLQSSDQDDPTETDPEPFLADVRPHLAVTEWTDVQLFNIGTEVCSDLDRSDGDVRALLPELIQDWKHAGYTDDDLPIVANDSALIINAAIHHLCPGWTDSYEEQFAPTPEI